MATRPWMPLKTFWRGLGFVVYFSIGDFPCEVRGLPPKISKPYLEQTDRHPITFIYGLVCILQGKDKDNLSIYNTEANTFYDKLRTTNFNTVNIYICTYIEIIIRVELTQ